MRSCRWARRVASGGGRQRCPRGFTHAARVCRSRRLIGFCWRFDPRTQTPSQRIDATRISPFIRRGIRRRNRRQMPSVGDARLREKAKRRTRLSYSPSGFCPPPRVFRPATLGAEAYGCRSRRPRQRVAARLDQSREDGSPRLPTQRQVQSDTGTLAEKAPAHQRNH